MINFTRRQAEAAGDWYGGMGSMLYAVASTGRLERGTIRPRGTRTDAEWDYNLAERLEDEAAEAAAMAREQAKQTSGAERTGFKHDAKALSEIADKAHREKMRLAPQVNLGRPRRRLGSAELKMARRPGETCLSISKQSEGGTSQRDVRDMAKDIGVKVRFGHSPYVGQYMACVATTDKRKVEKLERWLWGK